MRILLVNPNTTASMTEKAAVAARRVAAAGTTIVAATSRDGPVSIEGHYDGAMSLPGLVGEIHRAENAGIDAHVIACFDDTGLDAARSLALAPVIGIGEAAYHSASFIADRFSVVTTLSRSTPILRDNLVRYGLSDRCVSVRAADVPVLALEAADAGTLDRLRREIAEALKTDGAEAVVLGCAGMVDLAGAFAREFGVPIVEGVTAAVKLAESLVSLGLRTSKIGAWAPPIPKPYVGSRPGLHTTD